MQHTRSLGGYFRRFTGGALERWVRQEELKPVRAGQKRETPAEGASAELVAQDPPEGVTDMTLAERCTLAWLLVRTLPRKHRDDR